MPRLILSDNQWDFLQKFFNRVNIGYIKQSGKLFFEDVLFRNRIGVSWRDLSCEFGYWNAIYKLFNRWEHKFEYFIADRGYDSKALRALIFNLNKTSIILKHHVTHVCLKISTAPKGEH